MRIRGRFPPRPPSGLTSGSSPGQGCSWKANPLVHTLRQKFSLYLRHFSDLGQFSSLTFFFFSFLSSLAFTKYDQHNSFTEFAAQLKADGKVLCAHLTRGTSGTVSLKYTWHFITSDAWEAGQFLVSAQDLVCVWQCSGEGA